MVTDPTQQLGGATRCLLPSVSEVRERVDHVLLALVGPEARRLAALAGEPRLRDG